MDSTVRLLHVVDGDGATEGARRPDADRGDLSSDLLSPQVRAVAELARVRVDDLVEHLFGSVAEVVPSYGENQSTADRDDMVQGIRFTTSLFLATVCEDRGPTKAERRGLQRIGAQRFRQGVTRDDLLAMLEITRRAGYRFLLTLVPSVGLDDGEGLEVAATLSDRLSAFMPLVGAELGEGYRAAQAEPVIDGQARAVFVDRLLEGRWSDAGEIVEHGRRVGVDLTVEWGIVFAVPRSGAWSPRRAARALDEALGTVVVGQVRSAPVPHLPVLVRPAPNEAWPAVVERLSQVARDQGIAIAHATPCDLVGSKTAMWHADPLLRFVRLAWLDVPVVSLRHLSHMAMLSAAPPAERIEFTRDVLGELVNDPRAMDTLQATYEAADSSVEQVASRLHCHKNTVYQRWAKIERRTGLDLTNPADRQELLNAYLMWRCLQVEFDELDSNDGVNSGEQGRASQS